MKNLVLLNHVIKVDPTFYFQPPVKKRGRPKGSKDKQKRLPKGYKQLKLVRNFEGTETEWAIKDRNSVSGSQNVCQTLIHVSNMQILTQSNKTRSF